MHSQRFESAFRGVSSPRYQYSLLVAVNALMICKVARNIWEQFSRTKHHCIFIRALHSRPKLNLNVICLDMQESVVHPQTTREP